MRSLTLSQEQLQYMIDRATRHAPLEACGLLAGKGSKVRKVIAVRNQAQSPLRYVMDPYEQLAAFNWIESNSLDLIGIFHSHPKGPETVSPTDIAESAYAVVHLILACRLGVWKARGFWIKADAFREVRLQIE